MEIAKDMFQGSFCLKRKYIKKVSSTWYQLHALQKWKTGKIRDPKTPQRKGWDDYKSLIKAHWEYLFPLWET